WWRSPPSSPPTAGSPTPPPSARPPPPTGRARSPTPASPPDGCAARVTVGFAAPFDAGVLTVQAGEREWAKLCLELSPRRPTICTVVTRGHSDDANAWEVEGDTAWLRISRTGRAFACHASADGERWTFVRTFTLGTDRQARTALAGFMAQSPTGEGCAVRFDRITYRPYAPAGLRDGS
ncbi:DUF1349 domain-containing protein, partial [Streptomyces clavuligerus]|uniref:DUF1349 domain-containing protein n=1 Tax=Streptomyces clavuligerus TaxID=1901 RepID=UPI003F684B5E